MPYRSGSRVITSSRKSSWPEIRSKFVSRASKEHDFRVTARRPEGNQPPLPQVTVANARANIIIRCTATLRIEGNVKETVAVTCAADLANRVPSSSQTGTHVSPPASVEACNTVEKLAPRSKRKIQRVHFDFSRREKKRKGNRRNW